MKKTENSRINVYQELLKKIDKICIEEEINSKERHLFGGITSPTMPDLWQSLARSSAPSASHCPHCPHCKSPFSPYYPTSTTTTLLKSLKSCEIDLRFINSIIWMKSMITAVKNVPINEVKNILKALSIIDATNEDEDEATLEMNSQLMERNHVQSSKKIEANSGHQHLIPSSRRIKRKSNDDSAIGVYSPERRLPSYDTNLISNKVRKSMIPDTDEEASQRTPEISFSDDSQSPFRGFVGDSGIDHMGSSIMNDFDNNNDEKIDKKIEISSFKLSLILHEFPVNSVALSIVRMTFRALECNDTVQCCWRDGDMVINAVNVILEFINTVAIEEHKFPGYLDFFVKSAVQTVKEVYKGFEDKGHTILEKSHHLIAILELCNCKIICEEIISYLFDELPKLNDNGKNSNLKSSRINNLLYLLYLIMEKYYNILLTSVEKKSLNFFHNSIDNSKKKLFDKWSKILDNFCNENFHLFPTRISFLRIIYFDLKKII